MAIEIQEAFPEPVYSPSLYYPVEVPNDIKRLIDEAIDSESSITGLGEIHLTGSRLCAFKSTPLDPDHNPTLIVLAPKA